MANRLVMKESVQSLLLELSFNDTLLSTGTGFFVRSPAKGPVLVTNRHNFTGRHQKTGQPISAHGGIPNKVSVWLNATLGLGNWYRVTYPLLSDADKPHWVEHPTLGSAADVVALPIETDDKVTIFEYDLAPPNPELLVMPGDTLSVIGFPFGLSASGRFAIWATGFLATDIDLDYDDRPVFLIDCRARQGQSGSPVVAHRSGGFLALKDGSATSFNGPVSNLLGIYSGRINDQSDLGIVWKRTVIDQLVAAV